ncbi:MAG: sialate O-acetylesterase, partial [Opitutaceae bacterium]
MYRLRSLALLLFFLFAAFSRADVSLAPIFADHAVLQCGKPVPIWGRADAGETVIVTFHGQVVGTTAGADGRWIVYLDALPMSAEPADLTVTGKNKFAAHDVLVGEVWLCSGQSNMEFCVDSPVKDAFRVANAAEEVAAAHYPLIRHFKVKPAESDTPTDAMDGSWAVCSPATVGEFTAVGYFFARDIYEKLHVPVGLINSTWGGTPIESWMSPLALGGDPAFAVAGERWQKCLADYPAAKERYDEDLAAWKKSADAAKAAGKNFPEDKPRPPHGPSDPWTPTGLFNGMISPLLPYAVRGVLWYQGETNAPHAPEYHALFAALITAWRAHFGQGDLPFYFVQLAGYKYPKSKDGAEWALIREGQAQA